MTGAQEATDRSAKWLRRMARVLAVIWAGYWTFWLAPPTAEFLGLEEYTLPYYLTIAILALPFWVAAAIAWRRESVGGVALLVATFLLPWLVTASLPSYHYWSLGFMVIWVLLSLPIFVLGCFAGSLFLVSWRRSRTPATPEATE